MDGDVDGSLIGPVVGLVDGDATSMVDGLVLGTETSTYVFQPATLSRAASSAQPMQ